MGHYRITEYLDRGGMASVYKARHRFLGHYVAIKLLHGRYLNDHGMVRRFCNEARTVASIEHPGIVRYHDIGRTAEGRIYIVMELLQGESLSQRLRRGRVCEQQTIILSRHIASALAAAHERGVVHRDIKPENIFLVPDLDVPYAERAKVLDFGIAKAFGREVTSPGVVMGTPAYMAPEQCQPDVEIDARADIYSLGALMYRMVTGRPLFQGGNKDLQQQRHVSPPSPIELGVSISSELDEVIRTCLAKDPDHRYESMTALVERLSELEAVVVSSTQAARSRNAAALDSAGGEKISGRWLRFTPRSVSPGMEAVAPEPDRINDSFVRDITLLRSGLERYFTPPQARSRRLRLSDRRLLWSVLGGFAGAGAIISLLNWLT